MTREHLFFIPFIFALGFVVGALATHDEPVDAASTTGGRRVLWAGVLLLVVFVATHAISLHGGARHVEELLAGQALFDQRPSPSADEVHERIARFGPAGREAYRRMTFTSDLVFPVTLLVFLVHLARHAARIGRPGSALARRVATLVPLLWLGTDLVENAIIHHLLDGFPARDDLLAGALGRVTDTKLSLLVASVAVPAVLLAAARRLPTRSHAPPATSAPAPPAGT